MPQEIEEAFKSAKVSLFPAQVSDLKPTCSCPDYANPCKHIAAVYYLLGEQFDVDPFLIFRLRGRSREQIIDALHQRRAAAVGDQSGSGQAEATLETPLGLADQLASYWQTGDLTALRFDIAAPEIEVAMLRRLGPAPAQTDEAFRRIYRAMTEIALKKVAGEI